MKKIFFLFLSVVVISQGTTANNCNDSYLDIGSRLQDKFLTYEKNLALTSRLFDIDRIYRTSDKFQNLPKKYIEKFTNKISAYLPREMHYQYLGVLNFLLQKAIETNNSEEQARLISEMIETIENSLMFSKLVVKELAEDPLLRESELESLRDISIKAQKWSSQFSSKKFKSIPAIKSCVASRMNSSDKSRSDLFDRIDILSTCLKGAPLVGNGNFNLSKELGNIGGQMNWWHQGDLMSPTGFIPGNSVEMFYKVPSDLNNFYNMKKGYHLFTQDTLNGMGPYVVTNKDTNKREVLADVDFFKNLIEKSMDPFNEDGFSSIEQHPSFISLPETRNGPWMGEEKSIFKKIRDDLDLIAVPSNEKTTLFIDIFFLGESIGAAISKRIVSALASNPKLFVFILRDLTNHYGHAPEMMPIFNYLRAVSETKKDGRLVIAEAELNFHPTGLPNWANKIIPSSAQEKIGSGLALSPMSKSDHSKVLVINGSNLEGKAIAHVSSKNWLDTSGGANFDELISITGPAANIIQDNHIMDMVYALARKGQADYLENLHRQLKLPTVEVNESKLKPFIKAQQVVRAMGFDFFNHEETHQDKSPETSSAKIICSKMSGNAIISVGENNFNSHVATPLIQNLYLINHTTKNIHISDQFFAESNLVDATIRAAKERQITSHILLSYVPEAFGIAPANFPNIFYIAEMLHPKEGAPKRINVYLKKLYSSEDENLHEEFHKKTLTGGTDQWDIHISGSANKGFMTMRGAFRETQVMVFQRASEAKTLAKEAIAIFNDIIDSSKNLKALESPLVKVPAGMNPNIQPERIGVVKYGPANIKQDILGMPWILKDMRRNELNPEYELDVLEELLTIKANITGVLFDPLSSRRSKPGQIK